MSTRNIIENLDEEIINRLDQYVESAKAAAFKNRTSDVNYYRGHIYGYIDSLVDSGKINELNARKLRVHYGSLAK